MKIEMPHSVMIEEHLLGAMLNNTEDAKLSDLRDSGSIEQDADIVMLIDRYGDNTKLMVAKNRHGPSGVARLQFNGPTGRFRE